MANNGNLVSPSLGKAPPPLPVRPLSKVKLPLGVLPIPEIVEHDIEENAEKKRQDEIRKRDDVARNSPPKLAPVNADTKEKETVVEAGNLDPPFAANPPARQVGEQIERRANDGWFRVGPGVQEVGEELNQLARIPG